MQFKIFWIGLGYQRSAAPASIAAAIRQVCGAHDLDEALILGLATLNTKAAELCDLCVQRQWVLRGFTAQQLRAVPVPHPAATVMAKVATPSVAEAAAILAAQSSLLWVDKQIIRQPGQPSITLAVAQLRAEA